MSYPSFAQKAQTVRSPVDRLIDYAVVSRALSVRDPGQISAAITETVNSTPPPQA
ncbi:MAG: hypothetical protein ACJAVZ_005232 [Afipia broomeae]|jgi:hypothetical protein